jgi:hypothetical protein
MCSSDVCSGWNVKVETSWWVLCVWKGSIEKEFIYGECLLCYKLFPSSVHPSSPHEEMETEVWEVLQLANVLVVKNLGKFHLLIFTIIIWLFLNLVPFYFGVITSSWVVTQTEVTRVSVCVLFMASVWSCQQKEPVREPEGSAAKPSAKSSPSGTHQRASVWQCLLLTMVNVVLYFPGSYFGMENYLYSNWQLLTVASPLQEFHQWQNEVA